jgi:hypothetical protein
MRQKPRRQAAKSPAMLKSRLLRRRSQKPKANLGKRAQGRERGPASWLAAKNRPWRWFGDGKERPASFFFAAKKKPNPSKRAQNRKNAAPWPRRKKNGSIYGRGRRRRGSNLLSAKKSPTLRMGQGTGKKARRFPAEKILPNHYKFTKNQKKSGKFIAAEKRAYT